MHRSGRAKAARGLAVEFAKARLGKDIVALGLDELVPLHAHHRCEKVSPLLLIPGDDEAHGAALFELAAAAARVGWVLDVLARENLPGTLEPDRVAGLGVRCGGERG